MAASANEILNTHPAPWTAQTTAEPGLLVMLDGAGKQIQLFTILEFARLSAERMTAERSAKTTPA